MRRRRCAKRSSELSAGLTLCFSKRFRELAKIVLDLHDIYDKGVTIDAELNRVIVEAVEKKIALVEIIPGKGSGQLKKRVLRFLAQPDIKKLYHRLEKDDKNFGRLFIHFRH
ncbi:MAG: Smr/MutS family protein [Chloroflexi bacterium]|nr:Smr/MutS family protein [Chloroflexota bacterium]